MSNAESIQPDTNAVQRQIDALRVNGPWAHDIVDLARVEAHYGLRLSRMSAAVVASVATTD